MAHLSIPFVLLYCFILAGRQVRLNYLSRVTIVAARAALTSPTGVGDAIRINAVFICRHAMGNPNQSLPTQPIRKLPTLFIGFLLLSRDLLHAQPEVRGMLFILIRHFKGVSRVPALRLHTF